MKATTQHILEAITVTVCKNADFSMSLNKTKVYSEVARRLEKIDGQKRTPAFIGNLLRGDQNAGAETSDTIRRLHTQLTRPPRPRPADDEIATRTLKIAATVPELHRVQENFATRERTEIFRREMEKKND